MIRLVKTIADWCEERLGVGATLGGMLRHPVPARLGWYYVFGSATLTMFMLQVVTGICLAFVYVPAADEAYTSLEYLNQQQFLGWVIRALHYFGAAGMVVLLVMHMIRVFLMGAFKYPRELTWLIGVGLLGLTLALAFTGQVLRWDQDAYWGVGVGASMAGRVPVLGPYIVDLLLGGPTIGGETLSRFFGLHVFILPALTITLITVHVYLVLRQGISARPKPGQLVDPQTYHEQYAAELKSGEPFFPNDFLKDAAFSGTCLLIVFTLAISLGPYGPGEPPDPTLISAEPRPDWYFLPLFALLALCPPELEAVVMMGLPVIVGGILVLLPFVAGKGERSPRRRPVAVLTVLLVSLMLGVLGYLGDRSPWSPHMFAWSGDPIPQRIVEGLEPLELQGGAVFQNKTCRNCHALDGIGGQRGPDLTRVATRLTREELIRQVIQGGGNMPAYGQQLSPAEVEALVAFLETLHPAQEGAVTGTPDLPPVTNEPAGAKQALPGAAQPSPVGD